MDTKPYKCKYCGLEFFDKRKLAGHTTFCLSNPNYEHNINTAHKNREKIKHNCTKQELPCKYCGKICHNKGALSVHEGACKLNPNAVKNPNRIGNGGNSNGYTIWNKGKTALTDDRILKCIETRRTNFENKLWIPHKTPHTSNTKRILREKMIQYIKDNGNGEFGQHYSIKGCKYIDELNSKMNWNLKHALNGGEKEICGYFVDGYDEELNIVFEYDEPKHYINVYNNILCERDIQRQQEIINELNCSFYRYNEKIDKFYRVK